MAREEDPNFKELWKKLYHSDGHQNDICQTAPKNSRTNLAVLFFSLSAVLSLTLTYIGGESNLLRYRIVDPIHSTFIRQNPIVRSCHS